jgi:hypothetical protein
VSGAPLLDVIGCNGSGSHVAFHKIPDGLSAPSSRWGRFFMIFDHLAGTVEQGV